MDQEKIKKEMEECTFKPKVNKQNQAMPPTVYNSNTGDVKLISVTPGSVEKEKVVSNNRHEELLKWAEQKQKRIAESVINQNLENTHKNPRKLAVKDLEKSADRMHSSYLQVEKKRLDMQVKELENLSFKPYISKKSQMLAENKKRPQLDVQESPLPLKSDRNEQRNHSKESKENTNEGLDYASESEGVNSLSKVAKRIENNILKNQHQLVVELSNAQKQIENSKSPHQSSNRKTAISKNQAGLKTGPSRTFQKKPDLQNRQKSSGLKNGKALGNDKVQYHQLKLKEDDEDNQVHLIPEDEYNYEEYYNSTLETMNRIQNNDCGLLLHPEPGKTMKDSQKKKPNKALNKLVDSEVDAEILIKADEPKESSRSRLASKVQNNLEKQIQKTTQLLYQDSQLKSRQTTSVSENVQNGGVKKLEAERLEKNCRNKEQYTLFDENSFDSLEQTRSTGKSKNRSKLETMATINLNRTNETTKTKVSDPIVSCGKKHTNDSLLAIMKNLCQAVDDVSNNPNPK